MGEYERELTGHHQVFFQVVPRGETLQRQGFVAAPRGQRFVPPRPRSRGPLPEVEASAVAVLSASPFFFLLKFESFLFVSLSVKFSVPF